MIDPTTQIGIIRATEHFWSRHIRSGEFQRRATGKEVGHRIADYVEEHTVNLLDQQFTTGYQHNTRGQRMARGMGDIWIHSSGIFNPLNVKSGESGKNGQPNMVSLKKLLRALSNGQIDSYYLLIIKFDFTWHEAVVYLTDILDVLDFTHFDSGPGQLMLKEARFYTSMDAGYRAPHLTISQKISELLKVLEDGDRRLLINREREREKLTGIATSYRHSQPIDQSAFRIR